MARHITLLASFLVLLLAPAPEALGQGNPTGTIFGQVTDPDSLALPGVSVTVASAVLQGQRTAVTTANGDYIIPFLPPGEYTVAFEVQGFSTLRQTVNLKMADRLPVNVKLTLGGVTESVSVSAATETATTATVASTIKASTVELIPLGRTLDAATLLAPAAVDNGPGGNIMIAGALSYDNLNLINGVAVERKPARPGAHAVCRGRDPGNQGIER